MARRRSNNEGTIYQRKNGTWCAQITLNGHRLTKYTKTQRECRDWLKEIRSQIENGLTFEGAKTQLSKYMVHWLESVKPELRPKTWIQYEQVARTHIAPILGKHFVKDISPTLVQSLYTKKRKDGYQETTIRIIHAVLHRALEQAVRWGYIGRNPASIVVKPRPKRKEMQVMSDDQVRAFLSLVEGTRFDGLYYLAVTTGLRQGEILGLKWTDLDWKTGNINVRRQIQRITGEGLVFSEPKSAAGRRTVVAGGVALQKLMAHQEIQQTERLFAGERWKEYGLIFPSTIGTPFEPRNLYRHFINSLTKANLPKFRFHDLRHTAATLMLQSNIHPKVVQERLGHSTITLTLDTYSHVVPSMQVEAAEILDGLLTTIPVDLG